MVQNIKTRDEMNEIAKQVEERVRLEMSIFQDPAPHIEVIRRSYCVNIYVSVESEWGTSIPAAHVVAMQQAVAEYCEKYPINVWYCISMTETTDEDGMNTMKPVIAVYVCKSII